MTTTQKPKIGRPTIYSETLADEICNRLMSGKSLNKICPELGISTVSVWAWLDKYPEFLNKYAHAREVQADVLAEEIIAIADDPATEEVQDGDGTRTAISASAVQRNRLRVDARKWYASKLAPKKYGDKLAATVSGPDGGPLQHSVTVKFV